MLNYVEIGQNIVTLRKERGIKQEQLALDSGVSVSFLRDIEHGRVNVSLDTLEKLAVILVVPVWVLLVYGRDDESSLSELHTAEHPTVEKAVV